MDIGMNTEFKVKLSPKDDRAIYSQNLPMPIYLKENLTVELALVYKYGIITVVFFLKYAIPIFAKRKSLFCKLDCSQAHHCLQMADQWSVEMLAFIFGIADLLPTELVHKVLADMYLLFQVSCMSTRTQLSKLINVLNMWTILELRPTMLQILRGTLVAIYQCIRQAGLKLTMKYCHFGLRQIEFLDRTISSEG